MRHSPESPTSLRDSHLVAPRTIHTQVQMGIIVKTHRNYNEMYLVV